MEFYKLKNEASKNGISEIEVYKVISKGQSLSLFNGNVDDNVSFEKKEVYIRGVYNNHISSLYIENDDESQIPYIINTIKNNAFITESNDPYFIYEGDKEYPIYKENKQLYMSLNDMENISLKIENYLKEKSSKLTNVSVSFDYEHEEVSIENSNSLNVKREKEVLALYVSCVVSDGNDTKNGSYFTFLDSIDSIDYDKIYEYALKRTLDSLGAESIESKKYPVLFENKMFSSLMSCFLSMFSGEAVIKKMSLLEGMLGEYVFGKNITIKDLPLCSKSYNKYTFDDEGVSAKDTTIVKDGKLLTYLHNLTTAKMLDNKSTGNGFKNASGNISVIPTNLCFNYDDISFNDMIKDIKEGVFITSMMGQHAGVDPVTGSFNLQSSGFMIENGKITRPVTLIIVSGNIKDVLNNVVCMSNDFEVKGKVGCGSVFVKSLQISGK